MTEQVLGLARADIPGGTNWRGVTERPFEQLLAALSEHGTFRSRPEAESDPSWKQVIPYVVLRDDDRVFLMRRTRAGGDARLHDRYSIGIGGHVNPVDIDVEGGLRREWAEEIDSDFVPDFEPLAMLNDDGNAVGAVHLGLVYVAQAHGRPVAIREHDKLVGSFVPWSDVASVSSALETWSQLLFEFLNATRQRRLETGAGG